MPAGKHHEIIVLLFLAAAMASGLAAQPGSLYADPKASGLGDALTVVIIEHASASNQTETRTDKSNKLRVGSQIPEGDNILSFLPLHALQSDLGNQYGGKASTSRSARLSARITVTVVGKKPNGELIVEGVRTLKINGETEAIYLSGSVNPAFVQRDNSVLSSNIADLQIEYTGKGAVSQGSRPGLLTRFINWIF